jgi:pyruvate,water dikinase
VRRLGEPIAVRSSALDEDATERSAAGQYETILDVRRDTLAEAVAHVRATTQRARAYGADAEIAVILQRQIPATKAGVAFTRDPVTGEDVHVVECAFGCGDRVVSGNVTPDRYDVRNGHIHARVRGALRTLRDDELERLLALVRDAERGFGLPLDVEFCFERTKIWLLQARPITTG